MKKYKTTVSFAKITVFVSILFSSLVNAQEALPDAPVDETAAPIGDYVWVLALVGLYFVFFRLKTLVENSNKFIK